MSDDLHLSAEAAEERLLKYIPERDYEARNYEPYGAPWPDLCKNCKHYYKNIHEKGLTKKEFVPKCYGHVAENMAYLEEEDFDSTDEYEEALIILDPVSWAYKMFPDDAGAGWAARWYQEEIMSCSSLKKVVRAGRRTGKTEAICVIMLWMAQVNPDFSILVIAPFEAQVNLIWDKILGFVNKSPEIMSTIRRNTKSPEHRLEFNNGSKIIGFSSSSSSSARSDKVRGQDAHYIVLDEADYLAADDIEAILAILASHPDCGMWASSTPKGTHEKFYQFCTQKDLGFKEFHYISAESPSWTQDAEDYFKASYDMVTYEHEFYAIFGIQEAGVFRNDLVDLAMLDYDMPRPKSSPGSRVVIGVDWNGQAIGTHIAVVEAAQTAHGIKYVLLETDVIKGVEFTQHASVDRIIELHNKYDADFIYVDHGHGETQVEMLQKFGVDRPGTKFHHKVKAFAMGGKVEILDPLTKQMIKKDAKPFMVNTTVLALERGQLVLPYSEDTQVLVDSLDDEETGNRSGVVQQMRNFSVERVNDTGRVTYSQGEEHTLTAYMLAITGFMLEFSELKQAKMSIDFQHVHKKNEDGSYVEKEKVNEAAAEAARQLDLGHSAIATIGGKLDGSKVKAESMRKGLAKGDRRAMRSYYRQTGRGLDKGSRGSRGF